MTQISVNWTLMSLVERGGILIRHNRLLLKQKRSVSCIASYKPRLNACWSYQCGQQPAHATKSTTACWNRRGLPHVLIDLLLLKSFSQVGQTDEDARDAGRHLRRLTIKVITNKVVLSLLIIILIAAVIFLSVYKWYPGAKEAIRGKPSTNTNTTRLLESQISCDPSVLSSQNFKEKHQ